MSDPVRTRRPTRQLISSDQIAEAALAVIDETGLDNFNLNAVAERLGVKTPSLYHHVRGRGDLLRQAARLLFVGTPLTPIAEVGDWREEVIRISRATWRSILAHPKAAPLLIEVPPRSILVGAYHHWERLLTAKGVAPEHQLIILEGADKLTYGSALFAAAEQGRRSAGTKRPELTHAGPAEDGGSATEDVFIETIRCLLRGIPSG